jgi:hypothetical protein
MRSIISFDNLSLNVSITEVSDVTHLSHKSKFFLQKDIEFLRVSIPDNSDVTQLES